MWPRKRLNSWYCDSCAFRCAGRVNSKLPSFCAVTHFASANTKEMSAVYKCFCFFQVKLRFTVWNIAVLVPMLELNSFMLDFRFSWTLKPLPLSWSDFFPFLLPCLPQREKPALLAKKTYQLWCYSTWVKQLCTLPTDSLILDHLQILLWLYPFNSLHFAGCKYVALLCCK